MPIIDIPQVTLQESGISERFFQHSLAKLKNVGKFRDQYRECCQYTKHFKDARKRGIGLCLFGPADNLRRYAFYGIAKAAIAQGFKVLVIDIEDVVQAHSEGAEIYKRCFSADLLAIPEMELPQTVVNTYFKSLIFKLIKKRCEQGRPILLATALELEHPEYCVDMLFPGVGKHLIDSTVLVSMDDESKCEWVKKGHAVKMASLIPSKPRLTTKKVPRHKSKKSLKVRFKTK